MCLIFDKNVIRRMFAPTKYCEFSMEKKDEDERDGSQEVEEFRSHGWDGSALTPVEEEKLSFPIVILNAMLQAFVL